jgi:hypothetical protein
MRVEDLKQRERASDPKDEQRGQIGLDRLVRDGEWKSLRGNHEFNAMPFESRALKAREAVSNRRDQLTQAFFRIARDNPAEAGMLRDQSIKPLDKLGEALDLCLIDKNADLPKELVAVFSPKKST